MKTIVTHDGKFHADEVFAIAFLKVIFKKIKIIRTRNLKDLDIDSVDYFVDISDKFDNEKYFDHHFKSFDMYHDRDQKLKKASFGLVFDRFADLILPNKNVQNAVRVNIVIPIDAIDNRIYLTPDRYQYTDFSASRVISSYNRLYDGDEELQNKQFLKAVTLAKTIIENTIRSFEREVNDKDRILELLESNTNPNFIVLDRYYNLNYIMRKNPKYNNLKFAIHPSTTNGQFIITKLRVESDVFFPESWSGQRNEKLIKINNIEGSVFCHKDRFIAANETLEGAIKMVKAAIKHHYKN